MKKNKAKLPIYYFTPSSLGVECTNYHTELNAEYIKELGLLLNNIPQSALIESEPIEEVSIFSNTTDDINMDFFIDE